MDPLTVTLRPVDPTDPALAPLISRHLTLMRASSPACSVHAMDAGALAEAGVLFFAAFHGDMPVAMGALKGIAPDHGELKSMHVMKEHRGAGLADALLTRLVEEARAQGFARLSLETGSQSAFAAARGFYRRHGFADCGPFGDYTEDPHSIFMTRMV
ncbi:MAG: GNAT family N-acetyltransferase [Silicimonas sp.]|nr:GNAT family N-acetyltransferase [Silicimonas sp.]